MTTYIGKVCAKHPENSGERYAANYGCIVCAREATRRYLAADHGKAKAKEWRASPSGRTAIAASKARYRSSEMGKHAERAYEQRPESKARSKTYAQSERGREIRRKINEKRKAYSKAWREANRDHLRAMKRLQKAVREAHISERAMPTWADRAAIEAVYAEARQRSEELGERFVVDHIYPLKGRLVSGLHVAANLQIIPEHENLRKNNRYEPG